MLEGQVNPARMAAFKAAFDIINDEFIDLEQLKSKEVINRLVQAGVKFGIAMAINSKVSTFKSKYKSEQAALDLLNLTESRFDGEGHDDGFFDDA
jgi:hypothetical protein